jgi:hypothetical protein
MIVVLTEERSMYETVRALMARSYPALHQGRDWFAFSHNGKSDLERNIRPRMQNWNFGTPTFIILRAADGGNCGEIKRMLARMADEGGKPYRIRIVCQELESWFLGDSEAVLAAYPHCRFSNQAKKYRNPDRMTNAAAELAGLTGDRAKVGRAFLIDPHLDPSRSCSTSFKVFCRTLAEVAAPR